MVLHGPRMMSHDVKRILIVGEHLDLLRKRVVPLALTGAQVVISDPAELETHIGQECFNVIILCHTLSDLSRRSVTESAHRRWPRIRVLQIFASSEEVASIGCPLDGHAPDLPDELVARTSALLGRIA